MKFDVTKKGVFSIIHLQEDIDSSNSALFDSLLETKILSGENAIIIDMTGVNFLDSSGATVLVRNYKMLQESGGIIILAGCNPLIMKLFSILGFNKYFRITSTLEEALLI